ncbi:hypothetical protein SAMN04487977_101423 [Treponema bryantii]|uniref:Uncharacterized protein n=1 Tax=Treponema bryantii TaxID=163 RepID=A0A1H9AQS1_9SPIR|nr:hypothetical protein [Treponema bryantii]SEP78807.1 hypothetical protein SAMN04487977_101423 [Treponema bryantii]
MKQGVPKFLSDQLFYNLTYLSEQARFSFLENVYNIKHNQIAGFLKGGWQICQDYFFPKKRFSFSLEDALYAYTNLICCAIERAINSNDIKDFPNYCWGDINEFIMCVKNTSINTKPLNKWINEHKNNNLTDNTNRTVFELLKYILRNNQIYSIELKDFISKIGKIWKDNEINHLKYQDFIDMLGKRLIITT